MPESVDLHAASEHQFGHAPDGIWSAPGRVNLIGEHTDYNGGLALPFAIDRRTRVALRLRSDRRVRLATDFAPGVVEASMDALTASHGWSRYLLGVVWAIGQEHDLSQAPGFDAYVTSTVPAGAGVSSSAALEAAACVALDELWALGLARGDMVRLCQRAENDIVGAPTGTLDQSAVLLAEPDSAVLLDFTANSATSVPLGLTASGLSILLIDSMIRHDHSTGGYALRRSECEQAAAIAGVRSLREITPESIPAWKARMPEQVWRRMKHVVTDNERTAQTAQLLLAGQINDIGPLLSASHLSQRDDFEDSVAAIDCAVDAALTHGALGARLTGGGFGGSCIALTPTVDVGRIGEAISHAVIAAGHPAPTLMAVHASNAAHRDEESS